MKAREAIWKLYPAFFFTKQVCMHIYINSSCVINKKDECKHRDSLESYLWSVLLLKKFIPAMATYTKSYSSTVGTQRSLDDSLCCVLSQINLLSVKSVEITFLFFVQYLWKLFHILKWWNLCLNITVTN